MKKRFFVLSIALLAATSLFYACGKGEDTTTAQTEQPIYDLLVDDGIGVIFTNYSTGTNIPAQFKLYDTDLRIILNGETFPGSSSAYDYHLQYVDFMLNIFGLDYHGTKIDKITCERSNDRTYQLLFGDYDPNGDGQYVSDPSGIPWKSILDVQKAPILQGINIPCTGGGKNFVVTMFRNHTIDDAHFTLYFDFTGERLFRGKIVITETGKKIATDGVALVFE